MRGLTALILALAAARGLWAAEPASAGPPPQIAVAAGTEEGKKVLVATVTRQGKPLENVRVAFGVKRTFGVMNVGQEDTLDDGTAAVPFPKGLPGGPQGELQIVAEIKAPAPYAGVRREATLPGGVVVAQENDPFPAALWSPRAPLALVLTIVVLLGGVWLTYLYVVVQLVRIRKGGAR